MDDSSTVKSPKRRAILVLRFFLLGAFFAILFSWLQPFAKRYQGKTLRDWIGESGVVAPLRPDVIDAFGSEAVPALLKRVKTANLLPRLLFQITAGRSHGWSIFTDLHGRGQRAVDWLVVLHHRGHSVFPALIEADQTNIILSTLCYYSTNEVQQMLFNESQFPIRPEIQRAQTLVARFGQGDINTNRSRSSTAYGNFR